MERFEIARALREIALLLEVRDELAGLDAEARKSASFKRRAYENAALAIEQLGEPFQTLVSASRLTEVPGIGKALASVISELWRTDRATLLEELRAEVPAGVVALARVPGVGPKRARTLHDELGLASVEDLQAACAAGRVRAVKGFGEKTEQKILTGIQRLGRGEERVLLVDALDWAEQLVAHLSAVPAAERVLIAGSVRRFCETVADLDLLVASSQPAAVLEALAAFPPVARFEAHAAARATARLASGLSVDVRVVPSPDLATALVHATGSREHDARLRALARERGLALSEWGLIRTQPGPAGERVGERLPAGDEADV